MRGSSTWCGWTMNTLYLEVPEPQRVRLDVKDVRVLANYLSVASPTGTVEVEAADLDTGGALAILAPLADVEQLVVEGDPWPGTVGTSGGKVETSVLAVRLTIGNWVLDNLELHASERFHRWLIGMPVLRHFDLLLREREHGGAWLCGPAPGLIPNARAAR